MVCIRFIWNCPKLETNPYDQWNEQTVILPYYWQKKKKRSKLLIHPTTWMVLKGFVPSEKASLKGSHGSIYITFSQWQNCSDWDQWLPGVRTGEGCGSEVGSMSEIFVLMEQFCIIIVVMIYTNLYMWYNFIESVHPFKKNEWYKN